MYIYISHLSLVYLLYVYQANYCAVIRVLDLFSVANGMLTERAYFDLFSGSNAAQFNRVWSNYSFFDSIPLLSVALGKVCLLCGSILTFRMQMWTTEREKKTTICTGGMHSCVIEVNATWLLAFWSSKIKWAREETMKPVL